MAKTEPIKFEIDTQQISEAFRPMRLGLIGFEVAEEVSRARKKHGSNADLRDGVGSSRTVLDWHGVKTIGSLPNSALADQLKHANDMRSPKRKHTRAGILLEEAFEAFECNNDVALRAELIQVAAMAVDWIADIDARQEA